MDKRVKFSSKIKLRTVQAVISGHESCLSAARKIGANKGTVQRWVIVYEERGKDGFSVKAGKAKGSYTGDFKVRVVQYMLKNRLSLVRTAAFFGIPGAYVVFRWQQIYEHQGAAGLQKGTRGRKRSLMANKKTNTKKDIASTSLSVEEQAALQKEVEYLRAENAFLKKLDALIQQEKAAQAQHKQQKPSGN